MTAAVMAALIAAAWVGAEDEPPPLDQIKGELKAAKSGAASELNAPSGGPSVGIPALRAAAEEPAPVPSAHPAVAPGKRAPDTQWLVHAMERPRTDADPRRHDLQPGRQPADAAPHASDDPDFMLYLYREQEIRDRAQRAPSLRDAESPASKAGDVGSFSDLLQHWISPHDLVLFGMAPGAPATADGAFAPQGLPSGAAVTEAPVAPPKGNPFLDALRQEPPAGPGPAAGSPPVAAAPAAPPQPDSLPGPMPSADAPPPRRDSAAPPPSHEADEKKYFPQLDRF